MLTWPGINDSEATSCLTTSSFDFRANNSNSTRWIILRQQQEERIEPSRDNSHGLTTLPYNSVGRQVSSCPAINLTLTAIWPWWRHDRFGKIKLYADYAWCLNNTGSTLKITIAFHRWVLEADHEQCKLKCDTCAKNSRNSIDGYK